MKRLALCSTAALLALASSTRPAAASGYVVTWGRSTTEHAPAAQPPEKAASGYVVTWGKGDATERSGYTVSWSRSGYTVSWTKGQAAE